MILCSFFFPIEASGQIDSLLIAPFKEKKSITYGFNNRRTFLLNSSSTIYGLYMGIQYGKRLKHVITINSNGFWAGEEQQVQLLYGGLAEEFTFLSLKRFDFISYIHAGLGIARYREMNSSGSYIISRELISPIELGIHGSFSVNSWLALNGGAGYRFVLLEEIDQLDHIYYKIGLSLSIEKFLEARFAKK